MQSAANPKTKTIFTLRKSLVLLWGIPTVGMVLGAGAAFIGNLPVQQSIRQATTEIAPLADLARTLQHEVLLIQDDFTDLSATRKQGEMPEKFADAEKHRQSIQQGVARFRTAARASDDAAGLARLDQIDAAVDAYCATGGRMATAFVTDGTAAGNVIMEEFDAASDRLQAALTPFAETQISLFETSLGTASHQQAKISRLLLASGLVVAAISAVIGILIAGSVMRQLFQAAETLIQSSTQNSAFAGQITTSAQALADGASAQAAALEETASTLEEISSMTQRNAASAGNAKTLSAQTRTTADTGAAQLQSMQAAMEAIKSSSKDITQILKTID